MGRGKRGRGGEREHIVTFQKSTDFIRIQASPGQLDTDRRGTSQIIGPADTLTPGAPRSTMLRGAALTASAAPRAAWSPLCLLAWHGKAIPRSPSGSYPSQATPACRRHRRAAGRCGGSHDGTDSEWVVVDERLLEISCDLTRSKPVGLPMSSFRGQ